MRKKAEIELNTMTKLRRDEDKDEKIVARATIFAILLLRKVGEKLYE